MGVGFCAEQVAGDALWEQRSSVCAPRAERAFGPKNTLAAFDHAVGLGCSFLELDVRATSDGVPVVIHDAEVDRVSDGRGPVSGYSAAELADLDAGFRWSEDGRSFPFRGQGIRIPTLREVLDRYPRAWISVDIKATDPGRRSGWRSSSRRSSAERTVVGSFSRYTARRFRRFEPHAHASACPAEVRRTVAAAVSGLKPLVPRRPDFLMVPEYWGRTRVVTEAFVRAAGHRETRVFVWTVNDEQTAARLSSLGVDGLITDFPAQISRPRAAP
ncbi:MAG: glycerophosphodiester phosphodiesterase [Halomonas sp.]|uniref:glycerophosphodiester phosphodiesterase n=1 Tax=Halomonas sp. TaxID=1486246 RepID=UPI002ACE7780|nr:glycerophosphodiester phosphodiesterase [Halomonas sp.]MDZ7852670.1 glycerophosphodiester phosphodiesterase [Halomonas sp.]